MFVRANLELFPRPKNEIFVIDFVGGALLPASTAAAACIARERWRRDTQSERDKIRASARIISTADNSVVAMIMRLSCSLMTGSMDVRNARS